MWDSCERRRATQSELELACSQDLVFSHKRVFKHRNISETVDFFRCDFCSSSLRVALNYLTEEQHLLDS